METFYQDLEKGQGWPRRSLSVMFANPAHFADSLRHVMKNGQEAEFWRNIGAVASLFWSDASGRGEFKGPDGVEPPVPGHVIRVTFMPDSSTAPSFTWRGERIPDQPGARPQLLLHGGLIYRGNIGWSIHT